MKLMYDELYNATVAGVNEAKHWYPYEEIMGTQNIFCTDIENAQRNLLNNPEARRNIISDAVDMTSKVDIPGTAGNSCYMEYK
ncbi:hypothetical protein T12_14182 [Trichinella patagoniensis]|uniref:Uncharacterized protein n=1 Tax=Trichinella patagoniensis TaxID=990121 RepID=A0A0V0ZA95_9BILA|nr:hypothetical protein T12_14182 [Trichinella patagoniensis]